MEARLLALGTELREIDSSTLAPRLRLPALFIHSQDDRVVSIADGRETAAHWPGAAFFAVDGLGHSRILRDDGIIKKSIDFLAAKA